MIGLMSNKKIGMKAGLSVQKPHNFAFLKNGAKKLKSGFWPFRYFKSKIVNLKS